MIFHKFVSFYAFFCCLFITTQCKGDSIEFFGERDFGVGKDMGAKFDRLVEYKSYGTGAAAITEEGQFFKLGLWRRISSDAEIDDNCRYLDSSLSNEVIKSIKSIYDYGNKICVVHMEDLSVLLSNPFTGELKKIEGVFTEVVQTSALVFVEQNRCLYFDKHDVMNPKVIDFGSDEIQVVHSSENWIAVLLKNNTLLSMENSDEELKVIDDSVQFFTSTSHSFCYVTNNGTIQTFEHGYKIPDTKITEKTVTRVEATNDDFIAMFDDQSIRVWNGNYYNYSITEVADVFIGKIAFVALKTDRKTLVAGIRGGESKEFSVDANFGISKVIVSSGSSSEFYVLSSSRNQLLAYDFSTGLSLPIDLGFVANVDKIWVSSFYVTLQVDEFTILQIEVSLSRDEKSLELERYELKTPNKISQVIFTSFYEVYVLQENGQVVEDGFGFPETAIQRTGDLAIENGIKTVTMSRGTPGGVLELVNGNVLQFGRVTKDTKMKNGDLTSKLKQFPANYEIVQFTQLGSRNLLWLKDKYGNAKDDIVYCWNNTHEITFKQGKIKQIEFTYILTEEGEIFDIFKVETITKLTSSAYKVDWIMDPLEGLISADVVGVTTDGNLVFVEFNHASLRPELRLYDTASKVVDIAPSSFSLFGGNIVVLQEDGTIRSFSPMNFVGRFTEDNLSDELKNENTIIKVFASEEQGHGIHRADGTISLLYANESTETIEITRDLRLKDFEENWRNFNATKFESIVGSKNFFVGVTLLDRKLCVVDGYSVGIFEMGQRKIDTIVSTYAQTAILFNNQTVIVYEKDINNDNALHIGQVVKSVKSIHSNDQSFIAKLLDGTTVGFGNKVQHSFQSDKLDNPDVIGNFGMFAVFTTDTMSPTVSPTGSPTISPTRSPTVSPTGSPTISPTIFATVSPTGSPTISPTISPTLIEIREESKTLIIVATSVGAVVLFCAIGFFVMKLKKAKRESQLIPSSTTAKTLPEI